MFYYASESMLRTLQHSSLSTRKFSKKFWLCCWACMILPPTQDWTQAQAVKALGPNHWTAREFPLGFHFKSLLWSKCLNLLGSAIPLQKKFFCSTLTHYFIHFKAFLILSLRCSGYLLWYHTLDLYRLFYTYSNTVCIFFHLSPICGHFSLYSS